MKKFRSAFLLLTAVAMLFGAALIAGAEENTVPPTEATEATQATEVTEATQATEVTEATDTTESTEATEATEPTEPTFTGVALDSLPVPVAGEAVAPYNHTDPELGFSITGQWYIYNYETGALESVTGVFEENKLYQLQLTALAAEGYIFTEEALYIRSEDTWYAPVSADAQQLTFAVSFVTGDMECLEEVWIDGLPEAIAPGQTIEVPALTTDAPVNLTAQWTDVAGIPVTGVFEDGKAYYLQITASPLAGYYLHTDLWFADVGSAQSDGVTATAMHRYSLLPRVDKVELSGITDAVVGQPPVKDGVTVPEGAGYTLDTNGIIWHNLTVDEEWTVFADGNKYRLEIRLSAAQDYQFADQLQLTINGQPVENAYMEWESNYCHVYLEYSFLKIVDRIDITGVTDAAVGQTPVLEGIQLPEGVTLDMDNTKWFEWVEKNGSAVAVPVTAFQDGHKYYLHLSLFPAVGYGFTEGAPVTVNGRGMNEEDYCNIWDTFGQVELLYSFVDVVDRVDISGVTDAKEGDTATTEGITITGGQLLEAYWEEMDSQTEGPFTGVFTAGKAYVLRIRFAAEEGSEFDGQGMITVNGMPHDQSAMYGQEGWAYLWFSFKKEINQVTISGVPQVTVGMEPSVSGLTVPADANYLLKAEWLGDLEEMPALFEDGHIYVLQISLYPKEGYEFAANSQILVDGQAPVTNAVYVSGDGIMIAYYYILGLPTVDTVQITVDAPMVGQPVRPNAIRLPEDPGYLLESVLWLASADGENWDVMEDGTFEDGKYYMVQLSLTAAENTYFSGAVTVQFNGQEILLDRINSDAGIDYIYASFSFGKLCDHTYGEWAPDGEGHTKICTKCGGGAITEPHVWTDDKDTQCDLCGHTREVASDNPPTGDHVLQALLTLMLSAAALLIMEKRKKE